MLVNWVLKESLGIQAHRDLEECKDHLDFLAKKGTWVPRGILGLQGQMAQKDELDPEE